MFKTGYLQFEPKFLQPEKNYNLILQKLNNIEADLVVLPELAITGYNFNNMKELEKVAEVPEKSDGVKELCKLAKEKKMGLIVGFAEKEGSRIFNSTLFINENGISARYRKIHLFFREKLIFEPGNLKFEVHNYKNVKFGMMICFDWFFPEVTRYYALNGCQLICHASNLVLNYCQSVMISRSVENLLYIITANRIGKETSDFGSLTFTGQSQIVAPKGELIYRSSKEREELFVTEINPSLADEKNITEMNNLIQDRRPEFYK